jgi:hypothetical protein
MKYLFSYVLFLFLTSFSALADQPQDPALLQKMLSKYTLKSPQVLAERHFFLDLSLQNNLDFNEPGLQIGVGYRFNYFGFDIRFSKGQSSYGEIRRLSPKNAYEGSSDNAEIDIARNKTDLWSHWAIEPGFSVSNQFFSGFLAGLTERARAGLAYGNYNDDVNNIPFQSYILTIEASVLYQVFPTSPWSLYASLNWNTGSLVRDYSELPQNSSYALPVSWVGTSLGIEYTF